MYSRDLCIIGGPVMYWYDLRVSRKIFCLGKIKKPKSNYIFIWVSEVA